MGMDQVVNGVTVPVEQLALADAQYEKCFHPVLLEPEISIGGCTFPGTANNNANYQLVGIVEHVGDSMQQGCLFTSHSTTYLYVSSTRIVH